MMHLQGFHKINGIWKCLMRRHISKELQYLIQHCSKQELHNILFLQSYLQWLFLGFSSLSDAITVIHVCFFKRDIYGFNLVSNFQDLYLQIDLPFILFYILTIKRQANLPNKNINIYPQCKQFFYMVSVPPNIKSKSLLNLLMYQHYSEISETNQPLFAIL